MKKLEDFLRPTQKQLFKLLAKKFKGKAILSKGNFILVRGTAPVMLIAHLDTVHTESVRQICASKDGNILMSPQGIGGDDRCGVFALVKIYQSAQVKPWLLFTCDEEVGELGAQQFCLAHSQRRLPNELDALKFLVEIDRKGSNDAVYYDCDNPDFEAYITGNGFTTAFGSFSDISLIAPELGVAAVNLSSGYYNAHTLHEFINVNELHDTIRKVGEIVLEAVDLSRFEYVEAMSLLPIHQEVIRRNATTSQPRYLSDAFRDLYAVLLDFYSAAELESFRKEYGDHILWLVSFMNSDSDKPSADSDKNSEEELSEMDIKKIMIYRQIGAKIAYYRTLRQMTQAELAKKVNLSKGSIGRIERGKYNKGVPLSTLLDIAEGLRIDLSALVTFSDEEKKVLGEIDKHML